MPKLTLEFDIQKGYSDVVLSGKTLTKEHYMQLPIIQWAVKNIGPILTAAPGEILHGDGWQIYADWDHFKYGVDGAPRVMLQCNTELGTRLITDFWIRFSP
jgi:hypothetical protein